MELNGHGDPPAEEGPVGPALELFIAELQLPEGSPKAVIAQCARRLAAWIDAGRRPDMLVRELRACVAHLADDVANPAGTFVDELRAQRHKRRVDVMLRGLGAG